MTHRKHKRRIRWHSIFLWHRYLGLVCALFVVVLAVTGLMLNHTEELELDSRFAHSPLLLDWYGIKSSDEVKSFNVSTALISQVDDGLYFNLRKIRRTNETLSGAVAVNDMIIVALSDTVMVLSGTGETIEELGPVDGVPAGIRMLGTAPGDMLVFQTARGQYQSDNRFLDWQPVVPATVNWSQTAPLPGDLRKQLQQVSRQSLLTVERVILDIHSGRILGSWGIYLVDAAAVSFLLLAAMGIWLWASRTRK